MSVLDSLLRPSQRYRNIVEARKMLALFDGESYGRDYISFEKFESNGTQPHLGSRGHSSTVLTDAAS